MKKVIVFLVCLAFYLCGCAKKEKRPVIEFWTTEIEADRMTVQNELAREFEAKNPGYGVKVVPVGEGDMNKKITAAKAAGRMPSVIRIGLEHTRGYLDSGIIDTAACTEVINEIGGKSFFEGVLKLVGLPDGKNYAAVPVDGWVQGIWYRKDWFKEKNLAVPENWDAILAAARAFHNPKEGKYGIVIGTDPGGEGYTYTQQVFEHLALSAGVRIFDGEGKISIDDKRFNEVVRFYKELAGCGPAGYNYWRQARQTYLTGSSAMIFYSPYIIDDIAGLVKDQQVLVEDLPKKTGFVSVIRGPGAASASYGQVVSFAILKGGRTEPAKKWIKFILSDGYERWLGMTPGGKTPVLKEAVEQWSKHEIFSHYEAGFAENLASGLEKIERWGYREGRSFPLISQIYGRKIIPRLINKALEDKVQVEQAARHFRTRLKELE